MRGEFDEPLFVRNTCLLTSRMVCSTNHTRKGVVGTADYVYAVRQVLHERQCPFDVVKRAGQKVRASTSLRTETRRADVDSHTDT